MDGLSKNYKREIKKRKRIFEKKLNNEIRNLKDHDPKSYWKILNRDNEGRHIHEKLSLTKFTEHFKKLANPMGGNATPSEKHSPKRPSGSPTVTPAVDRELNDLFTISELKKRIDFLKTSKAGGLDFVKNELLKNCSQPFLALMTRFFNSILVSGNFPDEWSVSSVGRAFKSQGDFARSKIPRGSDDVTT